MKDLHFHEFFLIIQQPLIQDEVIFSSVLEKIFKNPFKQDSELLKYVKNREFCHSFTNMWTEVQFLLISIGTSEFQFIAKRNWWFPLYCIFWEKKWATSFHISHSQREGNYSSLLWQLSNWGKYLKHINWCTVQKYDLRKSRNLRKYGRSYRKVMNDAIKK